MTLDLISRCAVTICKKAYFHATEKGTINDLATFQCELHQTIEILEDMRHDDEKNDFPVPQSVFDDIEELRAISRRCDEQLADHEHEMNT